MYKVKTIESNKIIVLYYESSESITIFADNIISITLNENTGGGTVIFELPKISHLKSFNHFDDAAKFYHSILEELDHA